MGTQLTRVNLHDAVTAHMHQVFTRVSLGQTVGEALAGLRREPPRGRIISFYVVDDEGRLQGIVPARRLILSRRDQPLADIMVRRVIALPAEATVEDACECFIQHRLLALPIVDAKQHLLDVVDVELYTDELGQLGEASNREHLFQLLGTAERIDHRIASRSGQRLRPGAGIAALAPSIQGSPVSGRRVTGGVAGAAVLGITISVALRWLRLKPRVAAGPVALAGADVLTILFYFNLARWLLG
jgi:Mg/Co/Ni transporter MgtE